MPYFIQKNGTKSVVHITIHSYPLTPCTLIPLVNANFFVSLLVLEIGPSKHSFKLQLQWWRVERLNWETNAPVISVIVQNLDAKARLFSISGIFKQRFKRIAVSDKRENPVHLPILKKG
jgi:hypothetical protein